MHMDVTNAKFVIMQIIENWNKKKLYSLRHLNVN